MSKEKITIRQQYAMAAMQGLIAHYGFMTAPDASLHAFEIADAMIRHEEDEREDKEVGDVIPSGFPRDVM